MRARWIFLFLLFCFQGLCAQTESSLFIEQLLESVSDQFPEDYDYSEWVERWIYYIAHPIDLNETTGDELRDLRFLSPTQVYAILQHRKTMGSYLSVYELQSVDGLDIEVARLLMPFVRVGENSGDTQHSLGEYLREGHHDLLMRHSRVLQAQRGYQIQDTARSRYLGSADRLLVRYKYVFSKKMQGSLNMKKDAGEQFFAGAQARGFDFYSASLAFQDLGKWKKIVMGDYALQFGQGLSMWTGMSFGKGALIQQVTRQGVGLKPYTSTNEYAFFRGLAVTYLFHEIAITPFISFKKLSATPIGQIDGRNYFSSIRETGLHRTPSEVASKGNLHEWIGGINIQWEHRQLTAGASLFYTHLGGEILPQQTAYNQYAFSGHRLGNGSLYVNYMLSSTYLFSEWAMSAGAGMAYLGGLLRPLSRKLSLAVQYRNYQKDYHTFYGQGAGMGSSVENERGLYIGLVYQVNSKVNWMMYRDYVYFPGQKYRVGQPSTGMDLLSQMTFTPNKESKWSLKYRYRNKEENDAETEGLASVIRHQISLDSRWRLNERLGTHQQLVWLHYRKASDRAVGWMLFQDFLYKPKRSRFSGNMRIAYFHTTGYNARIYVYEQDVLYAAAFPFYYGRGWRYYVNFRCKIKRGLDIWFRYASFYYPDLRQIGSGLDLLQGNQKSEIKAEIRIQF